MLNSRVYAQPELVYVGLSVIRPGRVVAVELVTAWHPICINSDFIMVGQRAAKLEIGCKPEWPRADYFKVRTVDGREYLLKHDLEADEWFLGQQW